MRTCTPRPCFFAVHSSDTFPSLFVFLDGADPLAEPLGRSGRIADFGRVKLRVGGVGGSDLGDVGLGDVVLWGGIIINSTEHDNEVY